MSSPANRWLAAAAARAPEGLAIRDEHGTELSYAELERRARTAAAAIGAGIHSGGARCAIELEPGIDHAVALHGVFLAGGVAQTIRPGLPKAERAAALDGWRPEMVIDAAWSERFRAGESPAAWPSPRRGLEAPLTRTLTSGTTGPPRAVIHTAANHLWSATASAHNLGVRSGDRWLCALPVDHVAGLGILIRSVIYGTAAVVHARFEAERVAATLETEPISHLSLVATQLHRLLELGAPLDGPRAILVGGGPAAAELVEEARACGAAVIGTYGLTETCSQIATLAPEEAAGRSGSAGRPLIGTRVETSPDGEILVKGPTVAPGAIADDGWLHTGDLGRLDADGYLWVSGRADELIISGGENVRPEEVERVLLNHRAVVEAAVVGRPDPEWGEAVSAAVVPAEGREVTAEELEEHCRRSLAPFKVPKAIVLTDELPRTASGKLRRRELR